MRLFFMVVAVAVIFFHSSKYKWYRFINWGLQSKCLITHRKRASERANVFEFKIRMVNSATECEFKSIYWHTLHTHTRHTTYIIFFRYLMGKIHWQDKIQLVFQLTVKIYILLLCVVCPLNTFSQIENSEKILFWFQFGVFFFSLLFLQ